MFFITPLELFTQEIMQLNINDKNRKFVQMIIQS